MKQSQSSSDKRTGAALLLFLELELDRQQAQTSRLREMKVSEGEAISAMIGVRRAIVAVDRRVEVEPRRQI